MRAAPPIVSIILTGILLMDTVYVSSFKVITAKSLHNSQVPTPEIYKPEPAGPVKLTIPKISVNADIKAMGEDSEGRMDVPNEPNAVSWWRNGPYPGSLGSAVVAGHFRTLSGDVGIFFRISDLEIGDEIKVLDREGIERIFLVDRKQVYPKDSFPLSEVFLGDGKTKRLNLITCTGKYLKESNDYTHRLVIYSKIKDYEASSPD